MDHYSWKTISTWLPEEGSFWANPEYRCADFQTKRTPILLQWCQKKESSLASRKHAYIPRNDETDQSRFRIPYWYILQYQQFLNKKPRPNSKQKLIQHGDKPSTEETCVFLLLEGTKGLLYLFVLRHFSTKGFLLLRLREPRTCWERVTWCRVLC